MELPGAGTRQWIFRSSSGSPARSNPGLSITMSGTGRFSPGRTCGRLPWFVCSTFATSHWLAVDGTRLRDGMLLSERVHRMHTIITGHQGATPTQGHRRRRPVAGGPAGPPATRSTLLVRRFVLVHADWTTAQGEHAESQDHGQRYDEYHQCGDGQTVDIHPCPPGNCHSFPGAGIAYKYIIRLCFTAQLLKFIQTYKTLKNKAQ